MARTAPLVYLNTERAVPFVIFSLVLIASSLFSVLISGVCLLLIGPPFFGLLPETNAASSDDYPVDDISLVFV